MDQLANKKVIDLRKLRGPEELTMDLLQTAEDNDDHQLLLVDHFDLFIQEKKWKIQY